MRKLEREKEEDARLEIVFIEVLIEAMEAATITASQQKGKDRTLGRPILSGRIQEGSHRKKKEC